MRTSVERANLRDFVKRHCAITAVADGEKEQAADGYFRMDAGRTSKEARKAGAHVPWGEPEATFEAVAQRVKMLIADGHPKIYVRAIGSGDTYPMDSIAVEGDPEASLDIAPDPKGANSVNEAVAAVMLGQQRQTDRLLDRIERLAEERQEAALQAGLYMLAASSGDGGRMQALQTSLTALAPTLERTVPMLVSAWLGIPLPPPGDPNADPSDPSAAVDVAITELDAAFAKVAHAAAANPSVVTAERIARVNAIIRKYGGGGHAPPPPQGGQNSDDPTPDPSSTDPSSDKATETAG